MATIGRYQRSQALQPAQGFTVQPQNLATPAMMDIASKTYALAKEAEQVIQKHVDDRDAAEVQDMVNRLRSENREFMGMQYQKKGAAGIRVYEDSEAYFADAVRNAEQELKTQRKVDAFRAKYYPEMDRHLNSALTFQMEQTKIYQDATMEAAATEATADAIHNRWNPKAVEQNRREIADNIYQLNEHLGPEAARAKVEEATSLMYDKVIRAMAETNPYKAKTYYDDLQTRGKEPAIRGDIAAELEKMLNSTSVRQDAQLQADIIMGTGESAAEQRAMAKKITDPEVRSATEALVNAYIAEQQDSEARDKQAYKDSMITKIVQAGSESEALKAIKPVQDGKTYIELKSIAEAFYKPKDIVTDENKYYNYRRLIDYGQIQTYEQLLSARPYLSKPDWDDLEQYFRKGGPISQLSTSRIAGLYKYVTGKAPNSETEAKIFNDIVRVIKPRLPVERNATDEELMDAISDAVFKGEVPSGSYFWPNWDKKWYEAIIDGSSAEWMPFLNDTQKEEAKQWLIMNPHPDGKPYKLSEYNIGMAWKIKNLGYRPTPADLEQMKNSLNK